MMCHGGSDALDSGWSAGFFRVRKLQTKSIITVTWRMQKLSYMGIVSTIYFIVSTKFNDNLRRWIFLIFLTVLMFENNKIHREKSYSENFLLKINNILLRNQFSCNKVAIYNNKFQSDVYGKGTNKYKYVL